MTDRPPTTEPPKRYVVRTFGCQMNEHDSERIAGQFEADGMVATDDVEAADVVVLNTCCIRENADNKLYGTLGHLKSVKDRRPGMEIVVSGCLAQKEGTWSPRGPRTSTWCSAPTTSGRRAAATTSPRAIVTRSSPRPSPRTTSCSRPPFRRAGVRSLGV